MVSLKVGENMYYRDANINNFDKFRTVNDNGLTAISDARKLFNKEIKEVNRHKSLRELTEQNLVREIKRNVSYMWADTIYLENAQKWLSMRENCDKRRNYNEKDCFEILTKNISEALDVDRVEIYRIDTCGYERYAYSIYFTISEYDYNFVLEIPVIKNLTVENREQTLDGKLMFGYDESRFSRVMLWHSYNIRDFKEAIKEITTSDKHKQHVSSKEK